LLKQRKAAVFKRYPFTIILLSAEASSQVQPFRIKLDPGSRTTGIAIVDDQSGQVLFAAELAHRGQQIKKALDAPRAVRHHRRARHTRYRKPRFDNRAKGTQDIAVFLKKKPDVLKRILAQAKAPLQDAAAVNARRWALYERLKDIGLAIECGSGGLTKLNRTTRNFPKTHWLDAAHVGKSTPQTVQMKGIIPLLIEAKLLILERSIAACSNELTVMGTHSNIGLGRLSFLPQSEGRRVPRTDFYGNACP
jgi:hypothetical protein